MHDRSGFRSCVLAKFAFGAMEGQMKGIFIARPSFQIVQRILVTESYNAIVGVSSEFPPHGRGC